VKARRKALMMQDCDSGFGFKHDASSFEGVNQYSNGHIREREMSLDEQTEESPNHQSG